MKTPNRKKPATAGFGRAASAGSVKIELRYNGDYPGYAYIRINDRSATSKEEAALVTIFGASGIKQLFDMAGAERSHEEHKPWEGTLSFSQNDQAVPNGEQSAPPTR